MDTMKRTLIVLLVLTAAALTGWVAGQGFGQDAPTVRHYSALDPDGVEEHLMVDSQQMRAARVILERGVSEGAAAGPIVRMDEDGVLCFVVDDITGDVPPQVVGMGFCYQYNETTDTFRQYADGEGNYLPWTLEWCGENHDYEAPAGYKRGT